VIHDLRVGTGAAATSDSTVTVQYVGVAWSTKKEFDESWDKGGPVSFPLSQVVKGWQQGIPGMREGGRRELIIPPSLGYGAAGYPPDIGPNETLVFVIDLVKVEGSAPATP
jgi:peptidylprolyl isomerase